MTIYISIYRTELHELLYLETAFNNFSPFFVGLMPLILTGYLDSGESKAPGHYPPAESVTVTQAPKYF